MTIPHFEVHHREPMTLTGVVEPSLTSRSFLANHSPEAMRVSAMAADATAQRDVNLPRLWRDLALGMFTVVDAFFSNERCYLMLSSNADHPGQPITGRRLQILEAVLGGLLQKNVAIDLSLAPSTVALNSRLALESLGITSKPSRAHPLLMLTAKASRQTPLAPAQWSSFIDYDGRKLYVIGAQRPDRNLSKVLPTAELAVIRRLVEGLSYADIAHERGTSTRTIANQITAVFRRLRVSGRNELVQRLFFDESVGRPPPKPATETLMPKSNAGPKPSETWPDARRSA